MRGRSAAAVLERAPGGAVASPRPARVRAPAEEREAKGAIVGFVPAIDAALVERVQRGDEAATTELVTLVRPLVSRCASRFFADPSNAEDLAQTALMKGFTRIRDVRAPEAFPAWLIQITRNECLNELSRKRPPQVAISALDDEGEQLEAPAGGAGDPEEAAARSELIAMVRRVAASLPEHYRRTLVMRALEDRSYEEISDTLGVPRPVARLWYCRARKLFRRAFVAAVVARRAMPAACVDMSHAIADMIDGELGSARLAAVREHLAECDACRRTEDELRSTAYRGPSRLGALGIGLLRVPRSAHRAASELADRLQDAAGHLLAKIVLGCGLAGAAAVGAPALATLVPVVVPPVAAGVAAPGLHVPAAPDPAAGGPARAAQPRAAGSRAPAPAPPVAAGLKTITAVVPPPAVPAPPGAPSADAPAAVDGATDPGSTVISAPDLISGPLSLSGVAALPSTLLPSRPASSSPLASLPR